MVALELAQEFGDTDLEARARADRGLALINQGRIAEGFDQLDQAMAAIVAGRVSPPFSGTIFCAMLSACERTGDLKRAEDWSRAARLYLDRTCGDKLPILHSHCRTAYGASRSDTSSTRPCSSRSRASAPAASACLDTAVVALGPKACRISTSASVQ